MPRQVAAFRRLRRAAPALVRVLVLVLPVTAVRAADPSPPRGVDRPHPEAAKINQANSRVIHSGPGVPLTGAVHVPPAQAKKDKKPD